MAANQSSASPLGQHRGDSERANSAAPESTAPAADRQVAHTMTPTAFQPVNARVVAGNASATPGDGAASPAPPPKHAAVAPHPPQTSQTAQTSSGAPHPPTLPSQGDDPEAAMTGDAATYGTRSRNRAGNARPNYAEDYEMDLDFSSAATTTTKKKASAHDQVPPGADAGEPRRVPPEPSRFVAVNSNHAPGSNAPGPKEVTPSAASVAPTAGKKRKAPGTASAMAHTPPTAGSPAPTAMRKAGASSSTATLARETNFMTFSQHKSRLNKRGELIADDGTKLCVNDHVYLVSEPPGDPYYLCRIMEFLHARSDDPTSPVDSLRVNWYYRPRDVQRFNSDTRLVYGTMHSDMCPITALRGKCTIKHRSEIADFESYRREQNTFYFVQVFDRFIRRWYECIPVKQIINVPERVKKALDERWKFVVVEIGRVKELTSAVKTCKRCAKYCASSDSVDCAICKNSYHMNCVQPPLPKKPSRGFAWACGPCSRASEKKFEQKNTPTASGNGTEAEEEEPPEEEQPSASNDTTRAPTPSGADGPVDDHPATQAEIALAKMWPMRYLGIHCRVEDALQYDDRAIYPRASSRLGPRHQANVTLWPGRPVELVKPAEIKKRYNTKANGHKRDAKLTKETLAAMEAERCEKAGRPKHVQDEPAGYVARGEDHPNRIAKNTAKLVFKMPPHGVHSERGMDDTRSPLGREQEIDDYMNRAKMLARNIGVPPFGANFLDKALELLCHYNYNQDVALNALKKVDRRTDLHEPVLSKDQLNKFQEGVAKYGSEHRLIRLHMNTTLPHADIVRFYYLWKKTPKGREIWGSYGGRKGSKRKPEFDSGAQVQQSLAHDADDSAFDNDKAIRRSKTFQCKFCNTMHSRQWRKAPGVSPGQTVADSKSKGKAILLALCLRCASLWRKYAIQWEDIEDVVKKVASGGGRAMKRKIDEELLRELQAANEAAEPPPVASIEMEPPKKKSKAEAAPLTEPPKKKEKPPPPPKEPTPPPPPIIPAAPTWKVLPCAVCNQPDDTIACAHCRMTVHRQCYGVQEKEGLRFDGTTYWVCEQCVNDRNPQVSTDYSCCMCLTEETLIDLVEPPRVSHKKKTDREREKERLEKELADGMRAEYRNKQLALNRHPLPREPLKRTTGNNWVHVYCAVWTPEIRFSDAKALEVAEGFQQIPASRFEAVCKLCRNKDHNLKQRDDKGVCVSCFQCHSNFHASCAFEAGFTFGFDVTPVKGSRKDQVTTATLGNETGYITAGVWCKEHVVKSVVHPINEVVDESGKTAIQVFTENYKQADLTLTGTVRKANQAQMTKEKGQPAMQPPATAARRESTQHSIAAAVRRGARISTAADAKSEGDDGSPNMTDVPDLEQSERHCAKCNIDVTPKWHPVRKGAAAPTSLQRRLSMTLGEIADKERKRDEDDAPQNRPHSETNPQNIRFMPPGASGRAWDGMPERWAARAETEEPNAKGTAGTNGEPEAAGKDANTVYHNHGLPQYDSATAKSAVPTTEEEMEKEGNCDYLCHRCYLRKKLGVTTPPPEDRPGEDERAGGQSPKQDASDASRATSQPPFDPSKPIRMPWDDPPPPPPPPPPPQQPQAHPPAPPQGINAFGPYNGSFGPPAPHPPPTSTPFNNSYGPHFAPLSQHVHQQPPPPPPMNPHDPHAHNGYPFGPPPSHPPPPQQAQGYSHPPQHSYYSHPPPHAPSHAPPPHMHHAFPPPGIGNGWASPHPPQPGHGPGHLQAHPHPPHAPGYTGLGGPRRTESPAVSSQMPPLGPPRFSETPVQPPPQPPQQQQQAQTQQQVQQVLDPALAGQGGYPGQSLQQQQTGQQGQYPGGGQQQQQQPQQMGQQHGSQQQAGQYQLPAQHQTPQHQPSQHHQPPQYQHQPTHHQPPQQQPSPHPQAPQYHQPPPQQQPPQHPQHAQHHLPPQQQQQQQQPMPSPHTSGPRPDGQTPQQPPPPAQQPSTPREGAGTPAPGMSGGAGVGGASASPNLRNLLS